MLKSGKGYLITQLIIDIILKMSLFVIVFDFIAIETWVNRTHRYHVIKLMWFLDKILPFSSVHENHRTCQTFPMARPKCLMRDFTNLNRIYKAHRTNVWWTMKVFRLHASYNLLKFRLMNRDWVKLHRIFPYAICKWGSLKLHFHIGRH